MSKGNGGLKKIGQILLFLSIATAFPSWHDVKATGADDDLQILLVRPNVENVIDVQQVTVTFNKPMVPLGDFEKLAKDFHIEVSPKVECQWRWLNNSTIACQLNQVLPPSNSYKITVPSGIKSLDGSVLKSSKTETFTTLHWDVVNKEIDWKGPDSPIIYLTFNQSMDLGSLQTNSESPCGKLNVTPVGWSRLGCRSIPNLCLHL